ncbi:zinc-binding dehydrogenase [Rhizobiales bacterium RZME27]|uniref:Zinc-binding dehydrogenase n=1 Tax=Endobacterium cereale TaxID=2663029 RepID=A0A6A8AG92_9HYPH|nr:quinone oxidoreductase [Endobacterium cereale]MQY49844.1 zinc-binding dehydrogenase [Endobacterium cereale]
MADVVVKLEGPGGPEKLTVTEQEPLQPGNGEILVRHEAIGMNFVDIYHRTGAYALPAYPGVIGVEGAGIVEAVGPAVTAIRTGDRIAYTATLGAYATRRILKAERAFLLPQAVDSRTAAASMLKAATAYMLLHKTVCVGSGMTVLVHAAAGGLGAILVRWAKDLGAIVIGTVSTPEKAHIARSHGADHLVIGRNADLVSEVRALTDGKGVDVVYDGIGGDTLVQSLRSLKPFGRAVTLGQAAGPVPPLNVEELRQGKSLSHASVIAFTADPANYRQAGEAAIAAIARGLSSIIAADYSLNDVQEAHRTLESGRLAGSFLLLP